jgi:hypothetical protein
MVVPFSTCTSIPSILHAIIPYISFNRGRSGHYFTTASAGQISKQAPHFTHLLLSILCGCFFSPVIALVGHTFTHAPQPVQRFLSIV